MPATVPASQQMAVVRVERVLDKPEAVTLTRGDMVTVKLNDPRSVQAGSSLVFYTNGRIFGNTIAVDEVGHVTQVGQQSAAMTSSSPSPTGGQPSGEQPSSEVAQIRQQAASEALRDRIASASVVLVGRVREVRTPSVATLADAQVRLPVSEHVPEWREAVIQVQDGIKGVNAGDVVVVRFPASEDVMWYGYPKLQVGQSGTFILHADTISGAPTAEQAGAQVPAYVVPNQLDVLPAPDADRVRGLIR
jgi:hypothetical protein